MAKNGTVAYVTRLPDCDLCKSAKAQYDAVMVSTGGWAYMCFLCWMFTSYRKLGVGLGQELKVRNA